MTEIRFEYTPLPVHRDFHMSRSREKCLFGAFGSGKTYALCAEAIALGLEQPGSRILITRKTVPELRDTTEAVFFDIMPTELYRAGNAKRMAGHFESFTLPNGSLFLFRSIDDWNKHKSLNVCGIFWDEADEFDEETVLGMSSRVRQRDPTREGKEYGAGEITRREMCFAANPAGHNWLYKMFVDPTSPTFRHGSQWFKSTSFDNPFLPVEYLEDLLQYPEPWIRRYVLCTFDDFAGQIYEEWAYDTHVIKAPLEGWGKEAHFWMGMDPGTQLPTAGLWVVVDRANHRLVGVEEYQEANLAANVHAKAWKSLEARHRMTVKRRVADPSIETRDRSTLTRLHDTYRKLGYNFQLGPKDHRDRIPALGRLIHDKRFVVTANCPRTFEAIRDYKWEDLTPAQRARGEDPHERPIKKNDHLVDCSQYLSCLYLPPVDLKPPKPNLTPEQEMSREIQAQIRKQLKRRNVSRMEAGIVR